MVFLSPQDAQRRVNTGRRVKSARRSTADARQQPRLLLAKVLGCLGRCATALNRLGSRKIPGSSFPVAATALAAAAGRKIGLSRMRQRPRSALTTGTQHEPTKSTCARVGLIRRETRPTGAIPSSWHHRRPRLSAGQAGTMRSASRCRTRGSGRPLPCRSRCS